MARCLFLLMALARLSRCDEEYQFWEAAGSGDVGAMAAVLAEVPNLDLEYHDDDGRQPLMLAVLGSHLDAATWLLGRGASADAVGRWPGPEDGPLAIAAGRGDLAMMDVLLAGGATPSAATGPGARTPLMLAAAGGQTAAVDVLLGVGAAVDARKNDGTTALCWAARGGHAATAQLLLDHGAKLADADDIDGSSPLHFAAQARDDGGTLRAFLAAGGDAFLRTNILAPQRDPNAVVEDAVNGISMSTLGPDGVMQSSSADPSGAGEAYVPSREDLRGGMTPLMSAASNAAAGAIEVLLQHIKDKFPEVLAQYINAVDIAGMTALAWACSVPNGKATTAAMESLIAAGARDDTVTVDGRALVHVSAEGGNARAMAWLVDVRGHYVDMPTLSPKKLTPLHVAAVHGNRACVKALLRRGADIEAKAPDGASLASSVVHSTTALDTLRRLTAGATAHVPRPRASLGATPLIKAAAGCHKGIAKLLLKRGADPLARLASGEFASQVAPKTAQGKMLKWSLASSERQAWHKLEAEYREYYEASGGAPPEEEAGVDSSLVEDFGAPDEEDETDRETEADLDHSEL